MTLRTSVTRKICRGTSRPSGRGVHTNGTHRAANAARLRSTDEASFTSQMADMISQTTYSDLPELVIHRSKRMIMDALGIGIIGASTDISQKLRKYHNVCGRSRGENEAVVWGTRGMTAQKPVAAFLNGISTHSMDFDDTWHPATHPSGAVLSSLLALSSCHGNEITSRDILTAFNVGIQVQGLLLRCSQQAEHIPKRFHPPAVVGIMGTAAAASNLLKLTSTEARHALAVAASYAGAPMANAGTQTKPFHAGKPAMCGLEAALLSKIGIRGNPDILEATSPGFAAFFDDYNSDRVMRASGLWRYVLEEQNVAIKRYPAYLGMHWAMDAAEHICHQAGGAIRPELVKAVVITAPGSKYIDRAIAANEHEARHSFQFNTCSMLLDGKVSVASYQDAARCRQDLVDLLGKTELITPDHITPSFETMYVDVTVLFKDGQTLSSVCHTPYGHWRKPLSDLDVEKKFLKNTADAISSNSQTIVLESISRLNEERPIKFLEHL